jgi:hypothetical protein
MAYRAGILAVSDLDRADLTDVDGFDVHARFDIAARACLTGDRRASVRGKNMALVHTNLA